MMRYLKITGLILIIALLIGASLTIFSPLIMPSKLFTSTKKSAINIKRQQVFINQLLPAIIKVNNNILQQRRAVQSLHQVWLHTGKLTNVERYWLTQIAREYHVPIPATPSPPFWRTLLNRIDIIPPSLVLAQAAVESAWGTSRFARQGNNLFGQHCRTPGCGIVPKKRAKGAIFEVTTFATRFDSIISYMDNLNTSHHYTKLRQIRQSLRQANKPITGLALTAGLNDYSSKKDSYVKIIQQAIKHYNLGRYDTTGVIIVSATNQAAR